MKTIKIKDLEIGMIFTYRLQLRGRVCFEVIEKVVINNNEAVFKITNRNNNKEKKTIKSLKSSDKYVILLRQL